MGNDVCRRRALRDRQNNAFTTRVATRQFARNHTEFCKSDQLFDCGKDGYRNWSIRSDQGFRSSKYPLPANVSFISRQWPGHARQLNSAFRRLEDTITFHLIERAQFPLNKTIYEPGELHVPESSLSLLDWMLRETERLHSLLRRYQSPDE